MKIRLKFEKQGSMRYIGHLDLMRYFQKALRRAELLVEYSQGFNPHQLMSFTSPLGVGMTSSGEYLDVRLMYENINLSELKGRINETMNDEIKVLSVKRIRESEKTSMSVLRAADYLIFSKKQYPPPKNFFHNFEHFMTQNDIIFEKEGKSGKEKINLAPFIYEMKIYLEGSPEYEKAFSFYPGQEPAKEDGMPVIFLKVSSGSIVHVKPEQPLKAYYDSINLGFEKIFFHYHRLDMYADLMEQPKETKEDILKREKKFISMNEFGVEA